MTESSAPAPTAQQPLPLLRNRNFLRFWGGDTISQFGAQFSQLALPVLAVAVLGASEFEVGVLGAAQTAAFLVVGLPAGAWIDRMLKRRVMIVADLVRAVALAAMPALWFAGMLQMWHLYVLGAVIGILIGYFRLRAFLTTLITLIIYRATYDLLTADYATAIAGGLPESQVWDFIGNGDWLGVPTVVELPLLRPAS